MSLREFFSLHREELIRACSSGLKGDTTVDELARELYDLLESPASTKQRERAMTTRALLGEDPAIKRARASIEQLSGRSRIPVFFQGEVGTGKRFSARLLHDVTYPDGEFFELRSDEQVSLLERKLALLRVPSNALSIGGISVYVNELSETSKPVQAALVQLLRQRSPQLRLIASSQLSLAHACRGGLLRSDLAFGFSKTVELPNLRDRLGDLPILLEHFASGRAPLVVGADALKALTAHAWPGNLTELSQLVEGLQRLDNPGTIEPQHLAALGHRPSGMVVNLPPSGIDLADLERSLLQQALALTENNRSRAACLLGLTRDQIRYRMSKLDLPAARDGE